MQVNGIDLMPEVVAQGWEPYFKRLQGPVFEKLVKDFWLQADCDDNYVVSHVLGRRIVITEISIAKLLKMEKLRGRQIHGVDNKSALIKSQINKEICTTYNEQRADSNYKFKDLHPNLKVWQKIILTYIHPRPLQNSKDYFNATQKYILYSLKTRQPGCLPFLLFNYWKEMVKRSRTIDGENKGVIS